MRALAAVTIAMMIASASRASGQNYFSDSTTYASVGAINAAEAYKSALSSSNKGVVESALAHVAMIKLTVPDCEMRSVKASITTIETKGATEEMRYKAWVVRALMDNSKLFVGIKKAGYDEPDALFGALSSKMAEYYRAN